MSVREATGKLNVFVFPECQLWCTAAALEIEQSEVKFAVIHYYLFLPILTVGFSSEVKAC